MFNKYRKGLEAFTFFVLANGVAIADAFQGFLPPGDLAAVVGVLGVLGTVRVIAAENKTGVAKALEVASVVEQALPPKAKGTMAKVFVDVVPRVDTAAVEKVAAQVAEAVKPSPQPRPAYAGPVPPLNPAPADPPPVSFVDPITHPVDHSSDPSSSVQAPVSEPVGATAVSAAP